MKRFLDYAGLSHLVSKIKEMFVQKEVGKELSSNDFTDSHLAKLNQVNENAQVNLIESIKRNGTNLVINNKSVDITVPTKVSDLTNDNNYKTQAEVMQLISDHGRMKIQIVASLPTTGEQNIMYLTENESGTGYSEWFYVDGKWEKLGDTTQVDLTGYLKESDLVSITTNEIDTSFDN